MDQSNSEKTWEKISVIYLETEETDFVFMMSYLTRICDDKLNLLLSVKCSDYGKYHASHLRDRIEIRKTSARFNQCGK